jgi:hypothetical protein
MAQGLLGGVYQPPVRSVDFRMFPAQPLPAPAPAAPGGGLPNGVGGTVAPVGNPLNSADIYAPPVAPIAMPPAPVVTDGGQYGDFVDPATGFDTGGVYGDIAPPPGLLPVPTNGAVYGGAVDPNVGFDLGGVNAGIPVEAPGSLMPNLGVPNLSDIGAGLGSAWDYLSTNGGNVYDPARAAVDPAYAAHWTTTGDAGGVGHQLAGLLGMTSIIGGGGRGGGTYTGPLGQGFAPDYLGGGGIGDGTEIANWRNRLL